MYSLVSRLSVRLEKPILSENLRFRIFTWNRMMWSPSQKRIRSVHGYRPSHRRLIIRIARPSILRCGVRRRVDGSTYLSLSSGDNLSNVRWVSSGKETSMAEGSSTSLQTCVVWKNLPVSQCGWRISLIYIVRPSSWMAPRSRRLTQLLTFVRRLQVLTARTSGNL